LLRAVERAKQEMQKAMLDCNTTWSWPGGLTPHRDDSLFWYVSASYASMFVSKDGAGNLCKIANQHNNSLSLWFYGVKHSQTFLSVAAKTPGANLDTKLKWSPSEDFNLTAGPADIEIRLGRARYQQQQHGAALSAWKLQLIQPRCW
jgi:hypothetical protein